MGSVDPDLAAIAGFIDGRLSEADRSALVAHLSGCLECRTTLATFARAGVPANITTTVSEPHANPPLLRGAAVWLPVAATMVLATSVGLLVVANGRAIPQCTGAAGARFRLCGRLGSAAAASVRKSGAQFPAGRRYRASF